MRAEERSESRVGASVPPLFVSKETYTVSKETYTVSKETYTVSKETYTALPYRLFSLPDSRLREGTGVRDKASRTARSERRPVRKKFHVNFFKIYMEKNKKK